MEEALIYLRLGFEHILDLEGYDHMLFLLAMVAPYTYKQYKSLLFLITAFTLGHCVTLILGGLGWVTLNPSIVELGIAITILLTAVFHLLYAGAKVNAATYLLILIFGLIHGLGFSGYIRSLMGQDNVVLPLLSFNLGIEAGQVVILAMILALQWLWMKVAGTGHQSWRYLVSIAAAVLAIQMILERI